MKTFNNIQFLFFFLFAGLTLSLNAQTGISNTSTNTYQLPYPTNATFTANTVLSNGGSLPVFRVINMAAAMDSVFAPDSFPPIQAPGDGEIVEMGEMWVKICNDSVLDPECPSTHGMVMDMGGEFVILGGWDNATLAATGLSVGDRVSAGQTLGRLPVGNPLHFEVYVPNAGESILNAAGEVNRSWSFGWVGRQRVRYDSHNRIARFCIGSQTRSLNNGETVTVSACPITSTTGAKTTDPGAMQPGIELKHYPQPADASLMFDLDLSTDQNVSLEVLDLNGRIIKNVLNNEALTSGHHSTTIELTDLKAGLYLYRLSSSAGMQTGKIIVAH